MRRISLSIVLAAVLGAAPAFAQPARPERPYRGIFGGGVGNAEQLLTVKFGVNGGYDDNILASSGEGAAAGDPRAAKSGGYGQGNAELSYSLNRSRVGFGASASTTQRRYTSVLGNFLGTYSGGVNGWFQLAKHTRLTVDENSLYQPFLSYSFFPIPVEGELTDIVEPSFDLAVGRENQWRHSVSTSLSQGISSRATLSFGGGYDTMQTSIGERNVNSYSGDGRLSLNVSRNLGVHFGYGYREARYAESSIASPILHNLDIGVDYNRPLSFSRRTRVGFSTGSTAVQADHRTVYRLTGNGRISYEFGRTWNAALVYTRDASILENLRQPVFADSLSLSFAGLATRKIRLNLQAGAALGTVGVATENNYDSYTGTVGVNYAMSRYSALTMSYSYFHYSFDRAADLPQLSSRELGRQSIQGGVSFWMPLVHRTRRPDAAR